VVGSASGQLGGSECHPSHDCDDSRHKGDEENPSLLQAKLARAPAGAWPSWPPRVAQHYVQLDGFTKTPIPRREVHGFTRELLIKYSLHDNPIKVHGDTAFIPFSNILEGEYSRNARSQDQKDYGVEKAYVFDGAKGSMLSDRVRLAFAEKSHTLYFPYDVPNATKAKLEHQLASQSARDKAIAKEKRIDKLTALSGLSGSFGPQLIAGGKDLAHEKVLREFVASDGRAVSPAIWTAMGSLQSELAWRRDQVTEVSPIQSSVGCLHFEDEGMMNFSASGVTVPLEKKFVVYRGRLAFYPNEEYQMSSGLAFFYHNKTSNSLDIFFGFSSVIDLMDSNWGYTSSFSIGPADGYNLPIPHEGRETSAIPPWLVPGVEEAGKAARVMGLSIPSDFTLLHSRREDLGCNDTVLSHLKENSEELRNMLQMMNDMKGLKPTDLLRMVPHVGKAYKIGMTWALCAVEYLRPVRRDSAVVMSSIAIMGFMHVIAELRPVDVKNIVYHHAAWNSYHGKSI